MCLHAHAGGQTGAAMIITLDMASEVPIYVQLRNQIVLGIGQGKLGVGESLPTVRQMAQDVGVNAMTVNKAYAILKAEGFIEIDRRHGATVCLRKMGEQELKKKCARELELLVAEMSLKGMKRESFLELCRELFDRQQARTAQE